MRRSMLLAGALLFAALLATTGRGQRWRGSQQGDDLSDRRGVPDWTIDPNFEQDLFTFVRVKYTSYGDGRRWDKWRTDFPDSDLNFPFRLQQLTSLKVNPQPLILELTDPRIHDYPWIYMIEPGDIYLSDEEVDGLRRYLENGGFLMVDDFWGEDEWHTFHQQMKRVFPDREPAELAPDHDLFRCVYELKEKPQVPSINAALQGRDYGITWERPDAREVHFRAISDDKGRIMVLICHNTDLGDGWEREGVDAWYFHEFSEKKAYPMGINIVTYAMTH